MSTLVAEARKIPAFMRRDFLVLLSYRAAFTSDLFYIAVQAVMFGFVAELVDSSKLPEYGGVPTSYFDFVMIGVIVTTVSTVLLQRVAMAVRQEQMIGTLEALLVTPTSPTTVQAGSVAFDLLFIPIRMALLLVAVALTLGLGYEASGILPSLVLFVAYVPFVWGLGLLTAAAIVTFRRGTGALGVVMSVLGLASGAFFPLTLLPAWLQTLAEANPVAIAMEGTREALIGGVGWSAIGPEFVVLALLSAVALLGGVTAFRAALAREHRRGTLGLY
ncbi:MAG TPA: ABC transporter permease [Solirubrobacteraceae bacterium]|nr:ABC transporter permease [Solirubrobacteraceae bacterium]